jgi:hypothetical protein
MLEEAIKENTAAIRELIAAIANGIPTTPAQVAAAAAEASTKEKPKATVGVNGASSTPGQTSPTADAAAQDPAAGAAPTAPAAASVSYDEVKAAILKLSQAKGREQVVAALTEFGVAKGPELKPEQFAGFIAKANELVAA